MDRSAEAMARRFCAGGRVRRVARHPGGHIHDTWFVTADHTQFVLQRLNDRVFPDCGQLMANVVRVLRHVRRRRERAPEVLEAGDGSVLVYDDADGRPWRAFSLVEGGVSHDVVANRGEARQVGRGLGRFFADVQDLPGAPLSEPIPGFKDFVQRRERFDLATEEDAYGRVATCEAEIESVGRHHGLVRELTAAQADGRLPPRVVHNDAKAANVLLDGRTGEAVCVIDVDTVGTGTVLFDVGDMLRSATVTSSEDAVDLAGLAVRDDLLESALDGYLSEAAPMLTEEERALIPLAGPLMAYENAIRFLTDHLSGDTYFRIDRPRHNLDRARTQIRVLEALARAEDRVAELVRRA